jgi:hypothetical protein
MQVLGRMMPQWITEPVSANAETAVAHPGRPMRPAQETLDGDSTLEQHKRTLPKARAYKVAFPFRNRARRTSSTHAETDQALTNPPDQ